MTKPRAVYYSILSYQPSNRALLDEAFDVIELRDPSFDSDAVLADCEICFAPLGYRFDAAKIDRCKRLRAIVTNTTGVPHIDVNAAQQRGIRVLSLKDEQAFLSTITPTAEHAIGLMLALIRHIPWAHQAVLAGRWSRRPFGAPAMLSRMRLGIVGYGRLGRLVGRYGGAFGMQVRFFDHASRTTEPPAEAVASLEELFAWAHVISLHVPANAETHKMIGAALLSRLRKGAYLVNTARGEIVDEAALLAALESGHLGGAALDVLDSEFDPAFDASKHPLVRYAMTHGNLLLTPHIGGSTFDAWAETERRVIDMAIAQLDIVQ
jgi:phosphoglycerate dehydrogenase-like enzyme